MTRRQRDPVSPAWPGGVALLLSLLFVVLLLGAPLWGAPLMVGVTLVYLLGWTRWRDARRARVATGSTEPTIASLLSSADPARLPAELRDCAFLTATQLRRQRRKALLDRISAIEDRISLLDMRLMLITLSELDRDNIRVEIGAAEAELAEARRKANTVIFTLEDNDLLLVIRPTRAECDCPSGHWGVHAIVDSDDGCVVRECRVCATRWIETTETSKGKLA